MLETAIVGGGLCGLSVARSLAAQGRTFAVYEARPRLGGRILSATSEASGAAAGLAIDLGPTWYWPDTQPRMAGLIAELGLATFPQHDTSTVLHLREADKTAEIVDSATIHSGARRLVGGMAQLTDAIARGLPQDGLHLGHVLTGVRDLGASVALTFRVGGRTVVVEARRVVLAIPPRLLAEHVGFTPGLDETLVTAMRDTATWMAAQAKVAITYGRPLWRETGQSGNAFVTHEQAVVGEIYDACDATGAKAALGGFLALSPDLRQAFSVGLPMLVASQMTQVFGQALEAQAGEQHYQDWAAEPYTCAALDRAATRPAEHLDAGNPRLRRALWNGKVHLGASETATHGAGYLEGALEAAHRIERALRRDFGAAGPNAPAAEERQAALSVNAASLARFSEWVATQSDAAFDDYCRRLNKSLATQQREQLTQRAVLESMELVYAEALGVLKALDFDMAGIAVERGRSALTPEVQKPFRELMQTLMDDVVAFNRTSCALSNFPFEHKPPKEYMQAIMRDIAAAWQEFSLAANALLLAKARSGQDHRAPEAQLRS